MGMVGKKICTMRCLPFKSSSRLISPAKCQGAVFGRQAQPGGDLQAGEERQAGRLQRQEEGDAGAGGAEEEEREAF